MESSRNKKRGYEQSVEDEADGMPGSKKSKLPALASVIVEALKMDSLQRLCSSLEPLLRRIVSEEVERALTKFGHAKLAARSPPPRIHGPGEKNLQLHFKTSMPPHLFTGGKVEGDQGAAIHVVLIDMNTGDVVQTGPESSAKLNVVVLEGDFNEEEDDNWTKEHFESHEVKEREGKRPILTGDLLVTLKEGFGTLGDLTFTDNSSWIRSRKFRLGLKVSPGYCDGIRVREAKTEGFAVKDHRGECEFSRRYFMFVRRNGGFLVNDYVTIDFLVYKKHYPPALHDEVWRLDRIAKDGALHKKLMKADIVTVEDFLRILVRDPQKLRNILGSGMSNRMWENTVEHAKTCVLGGKLYVYYADGTQNTGVVFNNIYELRGLIDDGQFVSLESLTHSQKISVDSLVKRAYDNWHQVLEYDGKFLSSLTNNTKKAIKSSAAPTVSSNYDTGRCTSTTQSRQQYMSSEPRSQYQSGNHQHAPVTQLIEFPFVRPDQTSLMILNNPQAALSGSFDHLSVGNAAAGGSYFPGDWSRPRNGHGLEDFLAEEIRVRSSEMLENDDMQRLLKTLSMGMTASYDHSHEACYSYGIQYEPPMDQTYKQDLSRGSGKAVVGWLKLKAALRWGIFVRKRAAERRAQLVELE